MARKNDTVSFAKLKQAIKNLSDDKREIAAALLNKATFMEAELVKLQQTLEKKGWTEEYTNGANQYGIKKSSEADVYNTMIKNYNSVLKSLYDMVPDATAAADPGEEFFK